MISKEELLSALIARGAMIEYVTVKELLKHPALWKMKPKTLGVRLLRLRREGLVNKKKLGKAYGYKLTQKGWKRHDYFCEKRKHT
jgi:RIO-like serine/threonine protein kinase